jgi:hypothetical protein
MISELFALALWWHTLQNLPGLLDAIGYLYGLAAASFALELVNRVELD